MTQVTDTAPKLYTLLLPTFTMTVTDFTLSGGRQLREESTVADDSRMISPGVRRHTLTLMGFVPDSDAAALAPKLEQLCSSNTALTFSFAGMHFESLHTEQYAVRQCKTLSAAQVQLTLAGVGEISQVTGEEAAT